MDLSTQLESVLFFTGAPMTKRELSRMLHVSESKVTEALAELKNRLTGRGIVLMENGDEVALHTAPEASELITQIRKEELERDLGKAGLETLAIILYQGPVTRARIDYIRGVNSAFIVRQLLVRGLIERAGNPDDARSFLYKPTMELLSFLGLPSVADIPDAAAIKAELASFEARQASDTNATSEPSHSTDTTTDAATEA